MKTIKIDPNSWHWSILSRYNGWDKYNCPDNLCDYRFKLIKTILFMFIAALVIGLMGYVFIIDAILQLGFSIYYGAFIEWQAGGFVLWILAGSAIVGFAVQQLIVWNENREDSESKPSIVWESFKSWKDKYCAKVELDSDY